MDMNCFSNYLVLARKMKHNYTFTFRCPQCDMKHTLPLMSVDKSFSHPCSCGNNISLTEEENAAVTVLQALVAGLAATDKKISIGA